MKQLRYPLLVGLAIAALIYVIAYRVDHGVGDRVQAAEVTAVSQDH